MKQTTHPDVSSRQERALEQRREQLAQWQNEPMEIATRCPDSKKVAVEEKIARCKAEIATLERRLGIVRGPQVEVEA